MQASMRELKAHLSEYIRQAAAGQTVIIRAAISSAVEVFGELGRFIKY